MKLTDLAPPDATWTEWVGWYRARPISPDEGKWCSSCGRTLGHRPGEGVQLAFSAHCDGPWPENPDHYAVDLPGLERPGFFVLDPVSYAATARDFLVCDTAECIDSWDCFVAALPEVRAHHERRRRHLREGRAIVGCAVSRPRKGTPWECSWCGRDLEKPRPEPTCIELVADWSGKPGRAPLAPGRHLLTFPERRDRPALLEVGAIRGLFADAAVVLTCSQRCNERMHDFLLQRSKRAGRVIGPLSFRS